MRQAPVLRLAVVAAGLLALLLAVATIILLAWLRSYAPLSLPAFGYGTAGTLTDEEGAPVAVLGPRFAPIELDLYNTGRWTVTIESITTRPSPPGGPRISVPRVKTAAPDMSTLAVSPGSAMSVRFRPHDASQRLFVTLRPDCRGTRPHTYSVATKLAVHYRYLHFFSRTQIMDAPLPLATPCA